MALDTPATIAVIGAGPMGLEATLYARFLGYKVLLYERARVCERLRQQGDAPLPAPFAMHCSRLGLAALQAQDKSYQPPQDETVLNAAQWLAGYLEPLARSDLVQDGLRNRVEVASIALHEVEETDSWEDAPASDAEDDAGEEMEYEDDLSPQFALLVRDADGRRLRVTVDAVIDASGSGVVACESVDFDPFKTDPDDLKLLAAVGVRSPAANWCILESGDEHTRAETNFTAGLDQIRAVFAVFGGREDLDLYKTIRI